MKSGKKNDYSSLEKMAVKLAVVTKGVSRQNQRQAKLAAELDKARKCIIFQNKEKAKRMAEMVIANKELAFQNAEKAKHAAELVIANKELVFQNAEKAKRAEELASANSYLANLISYANVPIIIWDSKFRITRINRAFLALLGRSEAAVLGRTVDILFPPEHAKRSMGLIKSFPAGEHMETVEMEIGNVNGNVSTVLWNSSTIFSSDKKTALGTIAQGHDITIRKQAAKALEETVRVLTERNAEVERFLYTASHDLKSPVVTVNSFLGHLERDLADAKPERVASDLFFIRAAAAKMGQLIEDLVGLARIGRVGNTPERFTLRDIADEVLAASAGNIGKRGVKVLVSGGKTALSGDRVRLTEIWTNLIENACKYIGPQKDPRVEVGVEKRGAQRVFFVRDNGIGIEPAYHAKIFGLFEKLDGKSEGTGVGLAIVQRVVGLYGGRIWVESAGAGQGSCFYFTLPKAASNLKKERNYER